MLKKTTGKFYLKVSDENNKKAVRLEKLADR